MSEVLGRGNPRARGLILGEAPGAEEERLGRPFIGPSGRLLSEALAETGVSEEEDVWITNVVKIRPPNNDTPTGAQIFDELGVLDFEISSVEPKAILALGNVPLYALTGQDGGVTKRRGRWEVGLICGAGIPVMPCVHPAYVRRDRRKWGDTFNRDIAIFASRIKPRTCGHKFILATTCEECRRVTRRKERR